MANMITTMRILLAIMAVLMIRSNTVPGWIAVFLIVICLLLDAVDGFVARYFKQVTLAGSIYDIVADRIIESIFFFYFASLGLFNIWFALIILIRGYCIDAIRTLFYSEGKPAFGPNSPHAATWTRFLTSSRISRGLYNTTKLFTFVLYAVQVLPGSFLQESIAQIAEFSLWLTMVVAMIRTIPVIYDGWKHYQTLPHISLWQSNSNS